MLYLISFLVSVVLFILYNWVYPVSVFLHLTVSPFIHGVSRFKINFFLLYLSILSLVAIAPFGLKDAKIVQRVKIINGLSIFAALVSIFMSFILFVSRFSLPVGKYAYHFKGAYNSVNYFAHIHTGKAAIAYLVKFFGLKEINEVCDTGLVFADYVSAKLVPLLIVSVAAAFITFVMLQKPVVNKWAPGRRFFVFIVYAFAGAHVLKCMIDGGPFSYDLLPSLIALHLLYISNDPASLAAGFKKWRLVYLLTAAVCVGICSRVSVDDVLHAPIGLAFMGCVYFILFTPLMSIGHRSKASIAALILCIAVTVSYWSMHSLSGLDALFSSLPPGDRVMRFEYPNEDGQPLITEHTSEAADMRIADIYRSLGDNPLRNRNTAIISSDAKHYTGFIFVLKLLRNDGGIKLESNSLMHIDEMSSFPGYGANAFLMKVSFNPQYFPQLWGGRLSLILQNNKYCMLYYLNHYFRNRGVEEYAIIPFYYFEVK